MALGKNKNKLHLGPEMSEGWVALNGLLRWGIILHYQQYMSANCNLDSDNQWQVEVSRRGREEMEIDMYGMYIVVFEVPLHFK